MGKEKNVTTTKKKQERRKKKLLRARQTEGTELRDKNK